MELNSNGRTRLVFVFDILICITLSCGIAQSGMHVLVARIGRHAGLNSREMYFVALAMMFGCKLGKTRMPQILVIARIESSPELRRGY